MDSTSRKDLNGRLKKEKDGSLRNDGVKSFILTNGIEWQGVKMLTDSLALKK